MIRINLALKKQASYITGKSTQGKKSSTSGFSGKGLSVSGPVLGRVVLPLLLCVLAYLGFDYYVEQKRNEMQVETVQLADERTKIQKELARIRGYEKIKADLENNERILSAKIETIEKLLQGRDAALKTLVVLSEALPKDVWLTEVMSTDTSYTIRGGATDISLITDVMSHLGTSIYFKDIALRSSKTDASGRIATFELTTRRQ